MTEGPAATTTQLGIYTMPVAGDRVATASPEWKDVEKRVEELHLDNPSGILQFLPSEGIYNVGATLLHVDSCGIDPSGFSPISHAVHDVNQRTGKYVTDYLDRTQIFDTLGCELQGHFYRCDSSASTIDFEQFGLDARVVIENGDFGVWSASTDEFIGLNPYTVRCEGKDCGREPASNLFGLISAPMPCTGIEGQQLILDLE